MKQKTKKDLAGIKWKVYEIWECDINNILGYLKAGKEAVGGEGSELYDYLDFIEAEIERIIRLGKIMEKRGINKK